MEHPWGSWCFPKLNDESLYRLGSKIKSLEFGGEWGSAWGLFLKWARFVEANKGSFFFSSDTGQYFFCNRMDCCHSKTKCFNWRDWNIWFWRCFFKVLWVNVLCTIWSFFWGGKRWLWPEGSTSQDILTPVDGCFLWGNPEDFQGQSNWWELTWLLGWEVKAFRFSKGFRINHYCYIWGIPREAELLTPKLSRNHSKRFCTLN